MCTPLHIPHPHLHLHRRHKSPIDPTANGYTLEQQPWLEADTWHVWKVNNNTNSMGVLSKIGIDLKENRICVFDANNVYDKFPANVKLSLRDLMMGIWAVKHGKKPCELRSVLIENTVGGNVQELRDEVYRIMQKGDPSAELVVRRDGAGATKEEQEAFEKLQNENPHGNGVKKMLEEYKDLKGREIKEFVLRQPPSQSLQIEIVIS